MKSNKTLIVEAMRNAKRTGNATLVEVAPGGRGQYDLACDATLELRVEGKAVIKIADCYSGDNQSGYCYRTFLALAENEEVCVRKYHLPEPCKKWLDSLSVVDEAEEIAKDF